MPSPYDNPNKHVAHLTKVWLDGKQVPAVAKLVLTAVPDRAQFVAEVTQVAGKETIKTADGDVLLVDEVYTGGLGEMNLALVRSNSKAADKARLEAAQEEDLKKLAAERRAQDEAHAAAADAQKKADQAAEPAAEPAEDGDRTDTPEAEKKA